ncbi:hypothetical protein NDI44_26505 [Trichocoleus sp. DQ-A3]|uniref:hypothetical protein n=1 Tax=Cyanophyceae TaxID=3028117 RepID=UPI0016859DC9|nr:hypothetical protein [Coleofasciculus sp. FACHB-125]MBD1902335.1 hypothetical protein [Coleofasciculus sp. FACHB-125]
MDGAFDPTPNSSAMPRGTVKMAPARVPVQGTGWGLGLPEPKNIGLDDLLHFVYSEMQIRC